MCIIFVRGPRSFRWWRHFSSARSVRIWRRLTVRPWRGHGLAAQKARLHQTSRLFSLFLSFTSVLFHVLDIVMFSKSYQTILIHFFILNHQFNTAKLFHKLTSRSLLAGLQWTSIWRLGLVEFNGLGKQGTKPSLVPATGNLQPWSTLERSQRSPSRSGRWSRMPSSASSASFGQKRIDRCMFPP